MSRPYISVNLAISLDGKISTKNYTPARFTPKADLQRLLELRSVADALLVGRGTLEADEMRLIVPDELLNGRGGPLRCVISRQGKWKLGHPFFEIKEPEVVLFVTSRGAEQEQEVGVQSLEEAVEYLFEKGVKHLHCEGGGELVMAMMKSDMVDEVFLTWAGSVFFGGVGAPTMSGRNTSYLPESRSYELLAMDQGDQGECYLHYRKKSYCL